MKITKESRTIVVPVIDIDGEKYDVKDILKFLDEAYNFEDTIGKEEWGGDYLYFATTEEKRLEPMLLKRKVIHKPKYFKKWNKKVGEAKNDKSRKGYYDYTKYYLGTDYQKFYDEFWEQYNKI